MLLRPMGCGKRVSPNLCDLGSLLLVAGDSAGGSVYVCSIRRRTRCIPAVRLVGSPWVSGRRAEAHRRRLPVSRVVECDGCDGAPQHAEACGGRRATRAEPAA